MTGCASILVNICESDKYEVLYELFVEESISLELMFSIVCTELIKTDKKNFMMSKFGPASL